MTLHKKIVYDDSGNPCEVIIPYEEFLQLTDSLNINQQKHDYKIIDGKAKKIIKLGGILSNSPVRLEEVEKDLKELNMSSEANIIKDWDENVG